MVHWTISFASRNAPHPFIFNLGHGVMQPTPPDHVAELVDAIRG